MNDAFFLGPKAENADRLEGLLLEVLHDHVFWRRNFHPSDPRLITEQDKRSEAFVQADARLRDELFQILAELKRGAPLFSPRQVGHMVSDPALPALVGYFAGLLYNQNNVVAEAAPETVRQERIYVAALARMIGYPALLPETLPPESRRDRTPYAWGHLASGGTVANIEALWLARNVQLYPLGVRLLAENDTAFGHLGEMAVTPAGGSPRPLTDLRTLELLNLPVPEVTDLHLRIRAGLRAAGPEVAASFEAALPSVRKAGLAGLILHYNETFPGDTLRPPVVLISQAAHYGWAKGMDAIGLGATALRKLPVDDRLRLDVDALAQEVRACAERDEHVLMAVTICGTTEEGAVDPVHRVEALRTELEQEGMAFWHHVDAAFGGYLAASLPRDEEGRALPFDREAAHEDGHLSEDVYHAVAALADVDSVTIDPHKWGYIPYGAGALLCRDYHVRDAVSYAAPYLPTDETAGFGGFLGQWTLEGSRPGASAVSAYLSQAVLPLDPSGHGALVKNCISASRGIVRALEAKFSSGAIALRTLAEPDTVGYCFALVPRGGGSLARLNAFTRRVWERVNVDGRDDIGEYDFILSKTELPIGSYRHVLTSMLPGFTEAEPDDATVLLLRSFVISPFVAAWNTKTPTFAERLANALHEIAADAYPEHALLGITERLGRRLQVVVIEESATAPNAVSNRLQHTPAIAAYLDVRSMEAHEASGAQEVDCIVIAAPPDSEPSSLRPDSLTPTIHWSGEPLRDLVARLVEGMEL